MLSFYAQAALDKEETAQERHVLQRRGFVCYTSGVTCPDEVGEVEGVETGRSKIHSAYGTHGAGRIERMPCCGGV